MRAVDTNVLVRLITRDDSRQVNKAEAFVKEGAWVSTLVLAETVWVLQSVYDLGDKQIATVIAMLLEHDKLALQDSDVVRAALDAFKASRSVGFTDCLVVAIAHGAGHTPVGSFDRKLLRVSGTEKL